MSEFPLKYEMHVQSIGPLVGEFIDAGILVFFGEGAPEELVEFSIIHKHGDLLADVEAGDLIHIGDHIFQVTAVGEVANKNIANLGHLVMKTNGFTTPELPGDVSVEAKPLPVIFNGMHIRITGSATA